MAARWLALLLFAVFASCDAQLEASATTDAPEEVSAPTDAPEEAPTTNAPEEAPATTDAPEEEKSHAGAVTQVLQEMFEDRLSSRHFQWINAAVALVVGIVMIKNGDLSFKYLVIFAVYIFSYMLCEITVGDRWPGMPEWLKCALSVEAGVFVAMCAYQGYAGVQLIIGLMIAASIAYYAHDFLKRHVHAGFADNDIVVFVLVNLAIPLGIKAVRGSLWKEGKITPLAIISAWIGGCLISTAVMYFAMFAAVPNKDALEQQLGLALHLPDEAAPWIAFVKMMVNPHAKPVGLFVNSDYNFTIGSRLFHLDYVFGLVMWVLFFFLGVKLQKKDALCPCGGKPTKPKAKAGATAQAREVADLDAPFLEEAA